MNTGHYGTPALAALLGALALLVVHLAVPFGIVDLPSLENNVGIDDRIVGAGDVASDFDGDRSSLPSPTVTFWGILLALLAGLLLVVLGYGSVGVTTARYLGWGLAMAGATGAWMALSSSAYWIGTGFTTLLGAVSQNPHDSARLWIVSPVLVAFGALALLGAFLRVATGVTSRRDGLRDQASNHTRVAILAGFLLVALLATPWSFQILDGDERRDLGACNATAICQGRIDWYSAWGASYGAELSPLQADPQAGLFASHADGLYGGILSIAQATEPADPGLFQHAAFSLKVLTAAAWTTFFAASLATLGPVIASTRTPRPESKETSAHAPPVVQATTALHLPALLLLAWAAVHLTLLLAYQWRPTFDDAVLDDAQSWWSAFLPMATVPLLMRLGRRQVALVRPLLRRPRRTPRERTVVVHQFD